MNFPIVQDVSGKDAKAAGEKRMLIRYRYLKDLVALSEKCPQYNGDSPLKRYVGNS
ncbi:MAG TPA: hypothetical protein VGB77_02040 [Abditibacteriaceae bacterium]|jgi:hypothetical protein